MNVQLPCVLNTRVRINEKQKLSNTCSALSLSLFQRPHTSIPSYLTLFSPYDASIISRLRVNRSRLNQSPFKHHRASTNMSSTCLVLVMMLLVFLVFVRALTKLSPLSSSFPFPFLLCSFFVNTSQAHRQQFLQIVCRFLRSVYRLRQM